MRKYLIFSLILTLSFICASQNNQKSVLFLGNSLTKYKKNKMTDILQKFIDETNNNLKIEVLAENGSRLTHHTQTIKTSKKRGVSYGVDTVIATSVQQIVNNNYDFIILQDPDWLIPRRRKEFLYPSIQFIDSLTNSKLLFYQPIPSFIVPLTYCYGCNYTYYKNTPDSLKVPIEKTEYKTIQSQIDSIIIIGNEITNEVALESIVIPTGEIIFALSEKYPTLNLTIAGEHPSKIVQYTLALTFYTYLTQNDPRKLNYNFKIKDGIANSIKSDIYNFFNK